MEAEHIVAEQFVEALNQLRSAIYLLDLSNAPAHIAAHVDLAAHQLQQFIDSSFPSGRVVQIGTNAEPH